VPLLGGLAVWATYLMGARLSGSLAGAFAAVLLAGSPTFLFEIVSPTSDVPCTAWWALSLALLLYEGRGAAFAAGLSTGLAILTRPNVVLAAAVPGAALVWQAARERFRTTGARGESEPAEFATSNATARVFWFAAGSVPLCIAVALINNRLYGSPFSSGYAPFDALYKWSHLLPNLARYPRWLLETETPIVLLGLAAPLMLRARAPATDLPRSARWVATAWLCFVAAVFVSYLFYLPFEEWWYVRFLMPAYPPLLVLTSAVLLALLAPLSRALKGGGELAAAVIVAVVAWRCTNFSIENGAHLQWKAEQRYATVGNYVASKLPDRAVLLSMQHSGGIRHYSGG
jgi:4-amino-4-deoxy-L-arabinose transferase-like glycosyltransferase